MTWDLAALGHGVCGLVSANGSILKQSQAELSFQSELSQHAWAEVRLHTYHSHAEQERAPQLDSKQG